MQSQLDAAQRGSALIQAGQPEGNCVLSGPSSVTILDMRFKISPISSYKRARRGPRRGKVPWRWVLLAALLLALWAAGDLAFVTTGAEIDHVAPADTIIVLGCQIYAPQGGPSRCISTRAGHAAELYRKGLAHWIIASGGPTDQGPPEAEVLSRTLQSAGVPGSAIVQEPESLNTIQNIVFSHAIMRKRGWQTAILVTEPFHINRAALIARDDGIVVYPSPAISSANGLMPPIPLPDALWDTASLMLYQVKSLAGIKK